MLAVAGAAAIGTMGAFALPGAASAHHLNVKATVDCVGDTATVTWRVFNSQDNIDGEVTKATPSQGTLAKSSLKNPDGGEYTELKVGAVLKQSDVKYPEAVAQVTVPAALGKVTLDVAAKWDYSKNSDKKRRTNDVQTWSDLVAFTWTKDQCKDVPVAPQTPDVTFESNCDGTVTVVIDNKTSKDEEFRVKKQSVDAKTFAIDVKVPAGKKSEPITVPKQYADDIKVALKKDDNGKALGKYKWSQPADSEQADYTGSFEPDCNGVTVKLTNPADGETLKVRILVNGQEKFNFQVAPGTSSEPKRIGRQDSLKIVVKVEGFEPDGEFDYTVPPGCGSSLPVTGVNAGLMAGGASVLVLGGAALFMMARRRRVQFTA
jgi:hypothetical protein